MQSRYDLMDVGVNHDTDSQMYPDSLSVNFSDFKFNEPPYITLPNQQLQEKPYVFCQSYYGSPVLDDVIMNINAVQHSSLIYNQTQIKFPTQGDLNAFIATRGKI